MPSLPDAQPETADMMAALEAAVDEMLADCDGDPRAALRSLILVAEVCEAEAQALREEIARLTAMVSRGYVRGRIGGRQPKVAKHGAE